MKKTALLTCVAILGLAVTPAFAASKTYQVTGPVLAMTADTITVQKGSEKWEIARGSASVPSNVAVGSKVTVEYTMSAVTVTSKDAKSKTAAPAKAN